MLGLERLCETRGDVPAHYTYTCVCFVGWLRLLWEIGVAPALGVCLCVPRALAKSVVRKTLVCARPPWVRLCVSPAWAESIVQDS